MQDQLNKFFLINSLDIKPLSRKVSLGIIIISCLILYINTFQHDFVMDDHLALVENNFVKQGFGGVYEIFTHGYAEGHDFYKLKTVEAYRPVTQSIFAVIYQVFGMSSTTYHVFQVLIYCLLCSLIFLVFDKLFGKEYKGLPLISTLVFVFHPIHTEVVANIKSLDELLSLTFSMGACLMLIRHFDTREAKYLVTGLVFYMLAMLSKETPVTLVAALPLAIYYFRQSTIKAVIPYAILMASVVGVFLILRWLIFKDLPPPTFSYLDNPLYLAEDWSQSLGTRFSLIGKYIWLLIYPSELTSSYFYDDIPLVGIWSWQSLLSVLTYLSLAYIAIALFKLRNPFVYSIWFYFITISIFTNLIIPLGNAFGERLVFTPSLGICLFIGCGFYQLLKWGEGGVEKFSLRLVAPIIVISFVFALWSVKVIDRNAAWKNSATLVKTDLKTSPRSHVLNTINAQTAFKEAGDDREKIRATIPLFQRALELNPKGTDRYGNYGFAYYKIGEYENAIPLLEQALRIRPEITDYQMILAICYAQVSWDHKADSVTQNLTRHDEFQRELELFYEISKIYYEQKKYSQAEKYGIQALSLAASGEDRGKALINLGNISFSSAQLAKAYQYYELTIEHDPSNTSLLNRTGNLAIELNNLSGALSYLTKSLRIDANKAETHALLNKYYIKIGNREMANLHGRRYNALTGSVN